MHLPVYIDGRGYHAASGTLHLRQCFVVLVMFLQVTLWLGGVASCIEPSEP